MARNPSNSYYCAECADVRAMHVLTILLIESGARTRRRLSCKTCGTRYTSYEAIEDHVDVERQKFATLTNGDVDEIRQLVITYGFGSLAMYAALASTRLHRPVSISQVKHALDAIGVQLMQRHRDDGFGVGEVNWRQGLHRRDQPAGM